LCFQAFLYLVGGRVGIVLLALGKESRFHRFLLPQFIRADAALLPVCNLDRDLRWFGYGQRAGLRAAGGPPTHHTQTVDTGLDDPHGAGVNRNGCADRRCAKPNESGEFFHEGDLVSVQTAQPIDRMLDYKAPEGGCHLGAFEVPLGPARCLAWFGVRAGRL
jgi:hypothetical protein